LFIFSETRKRGNESEPSTARKRRKSTVFSNYQIDSQRLLLYGGSKIHLQVQFAYYLCRIKILLILNIHHTFQLKAQNKVLSKNGMAYAEKIAMELVEQKFGLLEQEGSQKYFTIDVNKVTDKIELLGIKSMVSVRYM